jgi:hypothetical protein
MKKLTLCTILLLFILGTVGCTNKNISIDTEDVTANTFLAKANGEIQVATVEEFDKDYYKLNELNEFVKKEVDLYNQKAGGEKVVIESLKERSGNAVMLLHYTGMDQYTAFNGVMAAYFNGGIGEVPLTLPTTLVSSKSGTLTNTNEVFQNKKYKVLVMYEPYDVIVDGDIKYYSDNATLVGNNKIQSTADAPTVIVYKP